MEEEGARRRRYNGRGGAGARGFLGGLNEDDEDEEDTDEEDLKRRGVEVGAPPPKRGVAPQAAAGAGTKAEGSGGRAGQRDRGPGQTRAKKPAGSPGRGGFELDMDGATLLGRRHKRTVGSPLSAEPIGPISMQFGPTGSPMHA
jgi:hypothetical protein